MCKDKTTDIHTVGTPPAVLCGYVIIGDNRMSKIDQPSQTAAAALSALIADLVDERLRAAGISANQDTPQSLRMAAGLDIKTCAEVAGMTHCNLSRLEAGKTRRPRPETLAKIARAIGCGEPRYREAVAKMIARLEASEKPQ